MKMILRWFPAGDDSVTLRQIRQVPGVSGVATCLPQVPVGSPWPLETLERLRREIESEGLEMEVIESVNVHEDIKKGLGARDRYIEAFIATLRNLGAVGVRCLCYNLMPVLDWARSDVAMALEDGSSVLAYRHEDVLRMNPASMAGTLLGGSNGYSLPGWEPERIQAMRADIEFYAGMASEAYLANMKYFLDAVLPAAEEAGIRMAIHPDDPPWSIFGLPKLITGAEGIRAFLALNGSRANGLTLCTGSLGAEAANDLPAIAREFAGAGRVPFAHLRNVRRTGERDFHETAHPSACGDLDMYEIVRALHDSGFDGYVRPDHGRMIWGEVARPGYGLYDRALGASYLQGLWEAVDKGSGR